MNALIVYKRSLSEHTELKPTDAFDDPFSDNLYLIFVHIPEVMS
jgi:hypothetical protein